MTELILVRHGETAWNAEQRIQGHLDAPLNDIGLAQAKAVGERFRGQAVDALICSDLSRAMQTMQPIAVACGLPVQPDARLRERHLGVLQGMLYDDAQREMPETLDAFRLRHVDAPIEGGETLRQFAKRVIDVLNELVAAQPDKRIVVVTHGGVVDIAWRHANKAPLDAPRQSPIFNTSVNTFRASADEFSLVGWGDISHLPQQLALDDL